MQKLILFDIDGTLVKSIPNNPHSLAFSESVKNLYDIEISLDWGEVAGLTDRLIFKLMMVRAGWQQQKIDKIMPKLIDELERVYIANFKEGTVEILPGVKQLLAELQVRGVALGLLTGNLKAIAQTKLEDVGIYSFFTVGGFGSDPHKKRSDLVKIAAKRAGLVASSSSVYLIGDTPRDIFAAQEAGVKHTVAVATSHHSVEDLKNSKAEVVLKDLSDTKKVLAGLGI